MKLVSDLLVNGKLNIDKLIIGFGAGAHFLKTVYSNSIMIGSLTLPEVSVRNNSVSGINLGDNYCQILYQSSYPNEA